MANLKKTLQKIKVDNGGVVQEHYIYEKKVVTKITVNKITLLRRKAEIEAELAQINLDLAQITEDEIIDGN